jgi:hypothetical protein
MGGTVRMIVLARRGGEDEFVEAVRKNLSRSRLSRWTVAIFGHLLVLAGLATPLAIYYIARWRLPEAQDAVSRATLAGVVAGAVGGACVILGFKAIRDAIIYQPENRTARLMLEYRDKLQQQQSSSSPGQNQP